MIDVNNTPISNECLLVVLGSILSYYIIRLLFRVAQKNNEEIPIEQYRTSSDEVVELWTVGGLAVFFCATLMMTQPSMSSWVAFFIGIFAGGITGYGQRAGAIFELLGKEDVGGILFGSSNIVIGLILLIGMFYFILLLRSVDEKTPYWLSIGMFVLIYVGWVMTRQSGMPYIFPWWWMLLGTLLLISVAQRSEEGTVLFINWAIWGTLIGLLAAQGITFWGGTQWYEFIGLPQGTMSQVSFNQEQLIRLIRTQLAFSNRNPNRPQSADVNVKEELDQLKWGLQFMLVVPLLLGTWWWFAQ